MITVDVAADLDELHAIAGRAANPSRALGPVGDTIRGFFAEVFRGEGRRVGGWADLSRSYTKDRVRAPQGVQTGGLLRSLVEEGHRWHVATATGDRFDIGSKAPHGKLFVRGRTRQPARPIDRPDQQLAADVSDTLLRWMLGADSSRGV